MDTSAIKRTGNNSLLLYGILGIILIFSTNYLGFWWFTILIGIIAGIVVRRGWVAFILSLLIGGLGWGIELIYQTFFLPVTRTASLIASIIGLSNSDGWIVIVATILLGILFCECGTWFGSALKSLISLVKSQGTLSESGKDKRGS